MQNPDIIIDHKSNNFDFLRLLAASMVVVSHSFLLLGYEEPFSQITRLQMDLGQLGVAIFFCLSGYLITQSLMRSSGYDTYFAKRALRIFPALVADILIAVFIWGAAVTTLSLKDYFLNFETYRYLLNVFLIKIHYELPGVFVNNPTPNIVNGSLWTLPYEVLCYFGLVILHFTGILKNRQLYIAFYLVMLIVFIGIGQTKYFGFGIPFVNLNFKFLAPLLIYFGAGAFYVLWRDRISFNALIALALLIVWCLGFYFNLGIVASYFCLPYIVLWFAFEPRIRLQSAGKLGDFSYGLYIYSFPVQQTLIYFLGTNISGVEMSLLSFLFTVPLALFSWFAIEKKALKIKDKIFKTKVYAA